jgi:hypothetical protein
MTEHCQPSPDASDATDLPLEFHFPGDRWPRQVLVGDQFFVVNSRTHLAAIARKISASSSGAIDIVLCDVEPPLAVIWPEKERLTHVKRHVFSTVARALGQRDFESIERIIRLYRYDDLGPTCLRPIRGHGCLFAFPKIVSGVERAIKHILCDGLRLARAAAHRQSASALTRAKGPWRDPPLDGTIYPDDYVDRIVADAIKIVKDRRITSVRFLVGHKRVYYATRNAPYRVVPAIIEAARRPLIEAMCLADDKVQVTLLDNDAPEVVVETLCIRRHPAVKWLDRMTDSIRLETGEDILQMEDSLNAIRDAFNPRSHAGLCAQTLAEAVRCLYESADIRSVLIEPALLARCAPPPTSPPQ